MKKLITIFPLILLVISCASNKRITKLHSYALNENPNKTIIVQETPNSGGNYSQYGKPSNITNICMIFQERVHWQSIATNISQKWKIPIENIMAIMYQESSFKSDARPINSLGIQKSTAYGYAQVLNGTWVDYKNKTNNLNARRDNFKDSYEFIAWYMNRTEKVNAIPISNIRAHYLNYHEGRTGFKQKTYLKKPWLKPILTKIVNINKTYKKQLANCSQPNTIPNLVESDNDWY